MYKFLSKNGQVGSFLLGIIIVAIFLAMALPNVGVIEDSAPQDVSIFNFGIYATIGLIILCAVAMLIFGVTQVLSTIKTSWKGLAGLAVLVILFVVAYSTANGSLANEVVPIQASAEAAGVTDANLQFIGGSIVTLLVLVVLAVAAFIVFEIINFFK